MTPTQRTLAECRRRGWTAQVVEHWNPFARIRQDLFGCIDIVAITPSGITGIQACAGSSHAARVAKSIAEPRLRAWLEAGARFEVWSWTKRGARGKRKTWTLRCVALDAQRRQLGRRQPGRLRRDRGDVGEADGVGVSESVRAPCVRCGNLLHTGEGRVTVSFSVDELIELACSTSNSNVRRRLFCAAELLDENAVREALREVREAMGE